MSVAPFYKLNKASLNAMSDPSSFYCYSSHKLGLAYLNKALDDNKGLVMLTGPEGSGKSMLLHEFMTGVDSGKIKAVCLAGSHLSADKLLKNMASQLGVMESIPSEDTLFAQIITYAYKQHTLGMGVIVAIDDAQSLSVDCLSMLVKLASYKYDNKSLILMILVGSEKLRASLKDGACYKLEPLTASETASYVVHRLACVAGEAGMPISNQALGLIYNYSQGLPRFVNALCDALLSKANLENTSHIESVDVESVVNELQQETDNEWLPVAAHHDKHLNVAPVMKLVSDVESSEDLGPNVNATKITTLLDEVEMLLALTTRLDVSRWTKHSREKIAEYTLALQRQLKNFRVLSGDQAEADLTSSAQSLYRTLITNTAQRARPSDQLGEKAYQTILNHSFSTSSAGAVRVIKSENACKILELASRTMTCIQLGIFTHADKLESVFKEISGCDIRFVVGPRVGGVSPVLMWRVRVSENVMLYLVGVPIDDAVNSDEYLPLMRRLDAATVIAFESEGLAAEEKKLLLNALVLYGSENTRLAMDNDQPDGRNDQMHFLFQGTVAIPRFYLGANKESIMPVVLFQDRSFIRGVK